MGKITKKRKESLSKIDRTKLYSVQDASALVKQIANSKFDESIDLAVRPVSYTHLTLPTIYSE